MEISGGVAHLGERLNGIQEVVGSIPIVSTKKPDFIRLFYFAFNLLGLILWIECHSTDGF